MGGGRTAYRACAADALAVTKLARPKSRKLEKHGRLRNKVESLLLKLLSPQQIAAQLAADYPNKESMRVSHETIYQSLFVQGRGALRKELAKCLRTGRSKRRMQKGHARSGTIHDMVNIRERPPEVEDRAVPGHWEGDLILGTRGKSAVATLVERRTRYVMLVKLPNGRTADKVSEALAKRVKKLPAQLRRTLTWDQGKEMAEHAKFTIATGVQVYFCDPASPWQRGSNENTNGLLRQYMPKNTDLSVHTQAELNAFARSLNERPRLTLGWMTPSVAYARAVAMAA